VSQPNSPRVQPDKSGQKSIHIEIYKKNLIQPDPNPWWVGLVRGFYNILIALNLIFLFIFLRRKLN